MESIEQTFNGQADFGRRVQCTVSRNGDLAYRTYLQVTLPEINQTDAKYARWLDNPGHQLISMVEVEIGGQRIDRQYGDWMHIWNQLTLTSEQEDGFHKMIGNTTQLTYLTDPKFADVATACSSADVPNAVCALARLFPRPLSTFLLSSGSAATPVLPFLLLPFSITRSRLTLSFVLWMSASGLYPRVLKQQVPTMLSLPLVHTPSPSLPLLSMLTTFSLIPMSVDAWHRTPTSTSLSSFSSLVMNPLDPPVTKLSSISTTPVRSLSGLSSLM